MSLFSGFSSVSTVPMGSFANASLVGANTVNGPGPFSVSTNPAAFTAATSVVWSAELTALSTMSLLGYISMPPTQTVLAAQAVADASARVIAITLIRFFIFFEVLFRKLDIFWFFCDGVLSGTLGY